MKFCSAAVCGPGRVRQENQDNLYLNGKIRKTPLCSLQAQKRGRMLAAVADGMGGETHGDLASLAVVRLLQLRRPRSVRALLEAAQAANGKICRLMQTHQSRSGSTLAALLLREDSAAVVNLGDSRCYRLRGGTLTRLSRDHSVVQQMIDLEILTPEQARTHRSRHKLTQHLGIFPDEMLLEPHVAEVPLEAGDRFLLCSDGLTDEVEDGELERLLGMGPVEQAAKTLFDLAMERGGRDNITVLVVEAARS